MANGRNWLLRWFDADWYRYLRTRYPERLLFLLPVLLGLLAWAGFAAVSAMGVMSRARLWTTLSVEYPTLTSPTTVSDSGP